MPACRCRCVKSVYCTIRDMGRGRDEAQSSKGRKMILARRGSARNAEPMLDPVGPQVPPRALLRQRVWRALPQAARVPPMDYRDNLRRPLLHRTK